MTVATLRNEMHTKTTSYADIVRGSKESAPLIETTINEKFEEVKWRQHKSLNLRIRGLAGGPNRKETMLTFIHAKLNLPEISIA